MGALNYAGRSFVDAPVADSNSPLVNSVNNRHLNPTPIGWSAFFGGLALLIFFMLGVEVAVCSLVGSASHLAGGLYHRAVTVYQDFEQPRAVDATAIENPHEREAVSPDTAPGGQQRVARHHAALGCMQGPHNCN